MLKLIDDYTVEGVAQIRVDSVNASHYLDERVYRLPNSQPDSPPYFVFTGRLLHTEVDTSLMKVYKRSKDGIFILASKIKTPIETHHFVNTFQTFTELASFAKSLDDE